MLDNLRDTYRRRANEVGKRCVGGRNDNGLSNREFALEPIRQKCLEVVLQLPAKVA
jgi:hypothetical protein